MLINILNQFIDKHSKIIFGLFAILIIIAFMPGAVSMFVGNSNGGSGIGHVLKEDVSRDDLQSALRRYYIVQAVTSNSEYRGISDNNLSGFFSSYYAPLKIAKDMGISTDDKEIVGFLKNLPHFKEKENFSAEKYNTFITTKMQANGVAKSEVDKALTDYLIVMNLQKSLTNNIIVTDEELKTFYNIWNEEAIIKKATFKTDDYKSKINVDDTKLQAYLDGNKSKFQIPAKYKIATVRFENNTYLKKAQTLVTEDNIKDYYESHKYSYMKTPPKEDKKDTKTPPKIEYKPLIEVSKEINEILIKEKSIELASNKAQTLSDFIFEEINELPKEEHYKKFCEIVTKTKQTIIASDWFDVKSNNVKGLENETTIIQSVPKIDKNYSVSEAMKGNTTSAVMFLIDEKIATDATLAQVKEDVKKKYIEVNAANLADADAKALVLNINKELEKRIEFTKIKGNEKFKDVPNVKRSMMDLQFMMDPRYSQSYANYQGFNKLIYKTPTGQISETRKESNGTEVAYIVARNYPDKEKFDKEKDGLKQRLIGIKTQITLSNFSEWLNSNSGLYKTEK